MASVNNDVSDIAKTIAVPILVMHGRDDQTVPLVAGRNLASWIPNARFDIVEGGHQEGVGGTV
jgi:pimeloyl-ACP methyl ester carboxylesterase